MKRIVIAPYEAHQNLFKLYRKDNPFCDVKFYTLESFLNESRYQHDDKAILYLICKYGYDFSLASELVRLAKCISIDKTSNPKIEKLIDIQKELLENNLFFKNEYFDYEISNAEIDIYYYSNLNKELLNLIKDKKYHFIPFDNKDYPLVHNFPNNSDELSFVFNKISELIASGVNPNDIYLFGLTSSDELVFNRLKENYHLNFNNAFRQNYLSKNYVSRFIYDLKDLSINESLEKIENKNDDTYPEFLKIINSYKVDGVSKDTQIDIYKSILKRTKLPIYRYVEAVNVVDKPIAKEGGYLFIVNFIQGKYPIISRNNSYLSNEEKEEIGLNTSEDENAANLEQYSNYLRQNANIFVSYSNRNSIEKYYPSPLIQLLNLNVEKKDLMLTYYSNIEAKLKYANLLDLRRNYLDKNPLLKLFQRSHINLPYRSYSSSFKGVKHYIPEEVLTLSYSKVKTYYQCKYKYYLDRVLDLGEDETNFNLLVGQLAHAVFERVDENKSFDEIFSLELKKINDFDQYDWVYLRRIKDEIRNTFEYIKEFENQIENKQIYRETFPSKNKREIVLDDNTKLVGKIDKLIMFGDNSSAIIDYKSGHEEFSENLVKHGLSLQLPIYSLIAKEGDRFANKELAGLFIQRFIVSSAITSRVNIDDAEKPLLAGVYINDKDVLSKLDSSFLLGKSSYIQSLKVNKDGAISSNRAKDKEYFDSLSSVAREHVINASHSMLNNDFAINPKIVNGDNKSCKFCPYRDICYRDDKSFVILSNEAGDEND